jgi:hypothetical protein
MISSVMSSLEFVDTTKGGSQNLQRLWNWSLTLSTQPVVTTIEVTFTAGTVVFDLLQVCQTCAYLSRLQDREPQAQTRNLRRDSLWTVFWTTLPETVHLVIRN